MGSLEALLEFLRSPAVKIPVSGISIGPVHKHDVMRASIMMEKKMKEYAVILAFDVAVTKEAREYAAETGVKIDIGPLGNMDAKNDQDTKNDDTNLIVITSSGQKIDTASRRKASSSVPELKDA